MTQVSVKKEVLEDLIAFKMRYLNGEIKNILDKWKYSSSAKFLADARNGTITEAEGDAVSLRQLLKQLDELKALRPM